MRIPPKVESLEITQCVLGDDARHLSVTDEPPQRTEDLDVDDVWSMKVVVCAYARFDPVAERVSPDEEVHRG
jgi:hypothetical protein